MSYIGLGYSSNVSLRSGMYAHINIFLLYSACLDVVVRRLPGELFGGITIFSN